MRTIGLLIAGGRGTRMKSAKPKALIEIAGRTMADLILDKLRGHVDAMLVSTDDPAAFAHLGYETIQDLVLGYQGPLAALHAATSRFESEGGPFRILSVPGDTPFLPSDLAPRLLEAGRDGRMTVAEFAGRLQPATALWPAGALQGLADQLADPAGQRSLLSRIERVSHCRVSFTADPEAPDNNPFFNVNTPQDLERAARHLKIVD